MRVPCLPLPHTHTLQPSICACACASACAGAEHSTPHRSCSRHQLHQQECSSCQASQGAGRSCTSGTLPNARWWGDGRGRCLLAAASAGCIGQAARQATQHAGKAAAAGGVGAASPVGGGCDLCRVSQQAVIRRWGCAACSSSSSSSTEHSVWHRGGPSAWPWLLYTIGTGTKVPVSSCRQVSWVWYLGVRNLFETGRLRYGCCKCCSGHDQRHVTLVTLSNPPKPSCEGRLPYLQVRLCRCSAVRRWWTGRFRGPPGGVSRCRRPAGRSAAALRRCPAWPPGRSGSPGPQCQPAPAALLAAAGVYWHNLRMCGSGAAA